MSKDQEKEEESMKESKTEQADMYKAKLEREANRIEHLKMRKLSTEPNAKKCRRSCDLKSMSDMKAESLSSRGRGFFWSGEAKIRLEQSGGR